MPISKRYAVDNVLSPNRGQLLHNLLLFGRACRALGMDITPNRMLEVAHALEYIDLGTRDDFYNTLRLFMTHDPRDYPLFDEVFNLFWRRPTEGWTSLELSEAEANRLRKKVQTPPTGEKATGNGDDRTGLDPGQTSVLATYSTQKSLRQKDFAEMTPEELAQAQQVLVRIPVSLGLRTTRRYKSGKGQQLDLRRALRQSLRNQGEMIALPTRLQKVKARPIVLICDISGSMERYTRILLHFTHTLTQGMTHVESFVFGTRLTRITHPIRHKSIDQALNEVGTSVTEWGGGTMTGAALHTFNYRWSRRVLGQGAVVLLITDGWDRGDIDLLSKEAARLHRSCYRLIWLNPLFDLPDYEPLTQGAQALLPHVDDFLPVRNLANLEVIIRALQSLDGRSKYRRNAGQRLHNFL